MNRIATWVGYSFRVAGSFLLVVGLICTAHGEGASKSHTSKETVFMSRECKTGWEMDSQQGDQIVMRCVEQDDDANQ